VYTVEYIYVFYVSFYIVLYNFVLYVL